jgi:hypothetical protein
VLAETAGVVSDDRFVRRVVHAERTDLAVVVYHDVAVLPRDLGQFSLDDLARTAADGRHVGLADVEAADDHEAWHARDDSGRWTRLS